MASFSKSIANKYDVMTVDGTKATCEWLTKALKQFCFFGVTPLLEITFEIGEIRCTVKSIDEFVEQAYGAPQYSFMSIMFMAVTVTGIEVSAFVMRDEIHVSAASKQKLEKAVQSLSEAEIHESASIAQVIYVEQNNGIVNTTNTSVSIVSEKKDSPLKQWAVAIMQNLLANWVWYLLTIAVTALITWFSTK